VARMATCDRHVDAVVAGREDLPEDRGGPVADRGVVADGEYGGHLAGVRARERPGEEHAAMEAAEATLHYPALDGAAPEADGGEIRSRHDAVPARGEL
jgi:hypothetical protein